MDLLIIFEVTTPQSLQFNLKTCPVFYSVQVKMSVLSKNSILCKSTKKIQGREGNSWERLLCPPPPSRLASSQWSPRQKEKSSFFTQDNIFWAVIFVSLGDPHKDIFRRGGESITDILNGIINDLQLISVQNHHFHSVLNNKNMTFFGSENVKEVAQIACRGEGGIKREKGRHWL